jgi:hypothetical protein
MVCFRYRVISPNSWQRDRERTIHKYPRDDVRESTVLTAVATNSTNLWRSSLVLILDGCVTFLGITETYLHLEVKDRTVLTKMAVSLYTEELKIGWSEWNVFFGPNSISPSAKLSNLILIYIPEWKYIKTDWVHKIEDTVQKYSGS